MIATKNYWQPKSGFTLIELMLSVGIISILLMFATPVIQRYVLRNDMDVISNVITQDLYRAQSLARAGENDGNWGVYIQSGSIVIFQGNSYAARVSAKDEVYPFNSSITFTGTNEYVFGKFTGKPIAAGSTTVVNRGDSKTISVSAQGVIEY